MNLPPTDWRVRPIGDLVDVLDGRRIPVSAGERANRAGDVPYYGAAGQVGWINDALFDEELVLLGEDGVQFFDPNKPKAYRITGRAWVNNHAHVLRPRSDEIDGRYLTHYLNQIDYRGLANGTTRLKLTQAAMRRIVVSAPVIEDQRRIVDILEDHLSRLDAAADGLITAGRRVAAWEAAVLSECYTSAERVPLASVTEIQGGIQKQPKRAPRKNAYSFLRVANVTAGGLDLTEVHQIELFDGDLDRLALRAGDLLVVEGNGSPSQIGRAATWDGSIENCVHQNHLIRVRAIEPLQPEFLEAVWNAPQNRELLSRISSSSSGLHTLSVAKLKSLTIPLPSTEEQTAFCARVAESRLSRRRLDRTISVAQRRCARLRRALLQAAFSGRLTYRTSDDELEGLVKST
jgi:type I restriction enzyme, S subunit